MTSYQPHYRLEVRAPRSTDVTEATALTPAAGAAHSDPFRVTTHPSLAGWKPYLQPPRGRRGRLDPLNKSVDVGELAFSIIDQRTTAGGSNLSRWVTAFLGDPNGNPQWMALRVFVEESLDGGTTWASFWTGSIQSAKLVNKLRFELVTRDRRQDMRSQVFVGRPHLSAGGAMGALLPIGLSAAYGVQSAVKPLTGAIAQNTTIAHQGLNYQVAGLLLDAASKGRSENVVTDNLFQLGPSVATLRSPSGQVFVPQGVPDTRTRTRALVKRLDTGARGEFRVSYINMSWDFRAGGLKYVTDLALCELRPPAGVATGTPLVNNGAGYAIGTKTIASDGWTINITGIVKAGDLIKFGGHTKHYTVQADANSNGSGQATLTIEPGLSIAVVDNEALSVVGEPGFMKMPANAVTVEITLIGDDLISKTNPLLVNDVHPVQFWKDLLDGFYSRLWGREETVPTGQSPGDPLRTFPYDAAKFATLIADTTFPKIRLVLTKAEELASFVEQVICQPYQLGYYLDADGKVVPIDLRMPTSLAGIPTITDVDLVAAPNNAGWEQTRESAIGRARVTYYEDTAVPPADLLVHPTLGPSGAPIVENALLTSIDHPIKVLNLGAAQLSDATVSIDARGARVMAGEPTIDGIGRARWVEDKLYQFTRELRQPWGFGGMIAVLRGRRTANTNAKPGDLRLIDVDALPDAASHLRGGIRLMRCLEPSEDGLQINLRFLDLAVNVIANTPTLSQPVQQTGNTRYGAATTVTLNFQGEPVEVRYAVTETSVGAAPLDTSPLWTTVDFVAAARDVTVARLPSGKRVWFQGRSVAAAGSALKLPSAWKLADGTGRVDLATVTAPSALAVPGGTLSGRRAIATWTVGDSSLFTEIRLASPTTDVPVRIDQVPPGANRYELLGLDLSTNYKIEIAHPDSFGGYSAAINTTFTTTGAALVCPDPGGIAIGVGAA